MFLHITSRTRFYGAFLWSNTFQKTKLGEHTMAMWSIKIDTLYFCIYKFFKKHITSSSSSKTIILV